MDFCFGAQFTPQQQKEFGELMARKARVKIDVGCRVCEHTARLLYPMQ
jgi:hypothetical protein